MRAVLIAVLALLPLPAVSDTDLPTISITGTGMVQRVPDLATISVGVDTSEKTAAAALSANTAAAAKVIQNLKEAGIPAQNIQTSNFSIQPVYTSSKSLDSGVRPVDHYRVSNMVQATANDLKRLGTVLDALVRDGANRVNGISFGLSDRQAAMDDARRLAVANAKHKAALYAKAAGVTLGPILSISEGGGAATPHAEMMMMARAASPVPIEAGELSISADVNIVWQLAQ